MRGEKIVKVEVRRYANKKYYDGEQARYVTVSEMGDAVASGTSLRVVCDRTGDDITLETLARILYEKLRARDHKLREPFSAAVLRRLVAKVVEE